MRILNKLENFYTKYYRETKKSDNMINLFSLYCLLTLIEIIICKFLLDKQNIYANIFLKVFSLVIIFLRYLYMKKNTIFEETWTKRKMSIKTFLLILSLVMARDLLPITVVKIIHAIKGIENALIPGTVAAIGTAPDTIIYVAIIAPIIEELIYRGAGLSLFKKSDNKLEAIIFTSVFFGLMHGNLGQAINSIISGFIYGYVAIEFGIMYSMIFHILNNGLVYVEHFLNISGPMQIVSIVILFCWILNMNKIQKKLNVRLNRKNNFSIKRLLAYFMNPAILIFTIVCIWEIIMSI